MSPLSTERAGLAIGRDYVGFVELSGRTGARRVRAAGEARLEAPLFAGEPSPQAAIALARALREVGKGAARRYLPLHVSLPDALLRCAVFELEALPRGAAAQLELAAFRFARQGVNGAQVYACQPLGQDRGRQLLLAMALDGRWLELVERALDEAGMVAWTINANGVRQFNAFHERLAVGSGALVALAPDAWSLWLWDEQGRPRYARGRWRSGVDDAAEVAQEAERAILAYTYEGPERSISRVYLAGIVSPGHVRALDARLREACTPLSLEAGEGARAPDAPLLALAAALEQ